MSNKTRLICGIFAILLITALTGYCIYNIFALDHRTNEAKEKAKVSCYQNGGSRLELTEKSSNYEFGNKQFEFVCIKNDGSAYIINSK